MNFYCVLYLVSRVKVRFAHVSAFDIILILFFINIIYFYTLDV